MKRKKAEARKVEDSERIFSPCVDQFPAQSVRNFRSNREAEKMPVAWVVRDAAEKYVAGAANEVRGGRLRQGHSEREMQMKKLTAEDPETKSPDLVAGNIDQLNARFEQKIIAGKTAHNIGAGTLLVCLAEQIATTEVEPLTLGMVAWHRQPAPEGETLVVFSDSAFGDDVAKTNLTAILAQNGLANARSL
jgi:hypothetical protein